MKGKWLNIFLMVLVFAALVLITYLLHQTIQEHHSIFDELKESRKMMERLESEVNRLKGDRHD